ncbi:MAG: alpha/beta hydrolase [Muribaculaceae bacterium]|nr:alpha/beta hydrolase [Muribaculaceae bacterium]
MTEFIEIDGVRVHYRKSGAGRPLILMHGWGCNMDTVASVERVAAETHCVYNIDFPGFGQSDEPGDVWGVEKYTALVEELAKRLGIERPVLVGHSFGGRVGVLMASRTPVDKLILVDAAGVKPRRSVRYYAKVYSFKLMKALCRMCMSREKAASTIEKWRRRKASADYASASPRMRAILSRVVNEDLRSVMPGISAPTLLVWGENDTATPMRDARIMERLIPGAGLVSFPGCGHYSFLDNPVQFAAVLRSFLKS